MAKELYINTDNLGCNKFETLDFSDVTNYKKQANRDKIYYFWKTEINKSNDYLDDCGEWNLTLMMEDAVDHFGVYGIFDVDDWISELAVDFSNEFNSN